MRRGPQRDEIIRAAGWTPEEFSRQQRILFRVALVISVVAVAMCGAAWGWPGLLVSAVVLAVMLTHARINAW